MAVDLKTLLEKTQIIDISETNDKTCPICYEDYLQNTSREFPRKLPCGHTFGTECLLLWVSSRTSTSSVNCPICTKPIIYAIGAQYVRYVTLEYLEEVVVRVGLQGARLYAAVDKILGSRPFLMIFLTVLLTGISSIALRYFEYKITILPLAVLFLCISMSTQNRLATHRYRDLSKLLVVVALLVGTFLNRKLGRWIFYHAIFPFKNTLRDLYRKHDNTIVVLTLVAGVAVGDAHGARGRIFVDAVVQCIVEYEFCELGDALGW